jgi:DNA-binding SARP family transcriptional activator
MTAGNGRRRVVRAGAGVSRYREEPQIVAVRLDLLGGFRLSIDCTPGALPVAVQRVLAYVAIRDRPLRRSALAGRLWLGVRPSRAEANLRSALWRLRSAVRAPVLEADGPDLRLAPGVSTDVRDLVVLTRKLLEHETVTLWEQPTQLDADLLPDWREEWLELEREKLRQLRLHAREALVESLVSARRFAEAAEVALATVAADPFRGSARTALIRVYLAEGNATDAIAEYERFRSLLARKMGIEPPPDLTALVAGVRRRWYPAGVAPVWRGCDTGFSRSDDVEARVVTLA